MDDWFRLDLGDALTAERDLHRIREALAGPHGIPDACVYVGHESTGGLHCHLIVWFPPAAAPVARQWDAIPGPPPDPGGLQKLAAVCFAPDSADTPR